ncbi:glycerophosphodiester phosphodiesterase [Photorhabdus sp. S8-52]|nr:glycerophosphodiester phosphodiesterase [Photorhabdus sp. S10-54]RAW96878.1 glycerophosphodiester phosphodiesterase [Photorhabdus sp. S9-53]RAX01188.1 glycerophosphodiester phosphodiesterase [Photorhabdus sp. S8-52]
MEKMMRHGITATILLCCSASAFATTPQIIAHRAGTGDAPENTEYAISKSLENKADAIWITVQLSKDSIPVLYRPSDLNSLTNKSGLVSGYKASQLAKFDAGYKFGSDDDHPFRNKGLGIPTLEQVLKKYPDTFFYIDLKSPDADPTQQAKTLEKVLTKQKALARTRFYSTNETYLNALPATIQRFESRDKTRTMLANITMAHQCDIPASTDTARWYGLEMRRNVEVVEKYTLGEARSKSVLSWDKEAMECFRAQGGANIILFGIKTEEDFKQAKELGADGVLVDSPKLFSTFKTK